VVGVDEAIARLSKVCARKSWGVLDLQDGVESGIKRQQSVAAYSVL
jgi:hypothetical protein